MGGSRRRVTLLWAISQGTILVFVAAAWHTGYPPHRWSTGGRIAALILLGLDLFYVAKSLIRPDGKDALAERPERSLLGASAAHPPRFRLRTLLIAAAALPLGLGALYWLMRLDRILAYQEVADAYSRRAVADWQQAEELARRTGEASPHLRRWERYYRGRAAYYARWGRIYRRAISYPWEPVPYEPPRHPLDNS
jgi:hypothetical protein